MNPMQISGRWERNKSFAAVVRLDRKESPVYFYTPVTIVTVGGGGGEEMFFPVCLLSVRRI